MRSISLLAVSLAIATCIHAQDAATLIAQAESHYEGRAEGSELGKAIMLFEKALEVDSSNYKAAWMLSRACWNAARGAAAGQQEVWFEKGISAGRKAVENNASGCEGHFWLGVNQAMLAEHSGMFKALGLIDVIKNELNTSMKLDPDCECAGPQRALGKLYSRIPWFKGGSKKKAIASLKESLDRCPNDTQSRIFLAEIYLDQNQRSLAIQQLQLVLKQEPDPKWLPETIENKKIAAGMLDHIRNGK